MSNMLTQKYNIILLILKLEQYRAVKCYKFSKNHVIK